MSVACISNAKPATERLPRMSEPPFEESRRLTGANLYFDGPGAALETTHGLVFDDAALERWRAMVSIARQRLGWPDDDIVVRRHRSGASLAFAAPADQLYTATEVNEWAWCAANLGGTPTGFPGHALHAPGHAATWDQELALHTLKAVATAEAKPDLVELQRHTHTRGLPFLADDDEVTIGAGAGGHSWPIDALPTPLQVDWVELHGIPMALVTGSNGKTTTVRLLAAMVRADGSTTGYSSTDGLFVNGERIDSGDYSGPVGARTVLRHPAVQVAILETARGGLLRRGLAVRNARAAVVTNVSPDHFGEYGIHDLDDLAQVKLTVERALAPDGVLVLNADDPLLLQRGTTISRTIAWFALDDDHPRLRAHADAGGMTCGVRNGHMLLHVQDVQYDLGAVTAMPITLSGSALYNIANAAAAALAATALGVAAARIAQTLAQFGSQPGDNPGRLQRWQFGDTRVVLDYAHNPDGLRGLLQVAATPRGPARLGLILGQAGNREDADIRALAAVAAEFRPDRVWLKDIGGDYLRGRAAGEIAGILREELLRLGLPPAGMVVCLEETAAAREALQWAQPGDVLVLPIHEPDSRDAIVALLDSMHVDHWRAGMPLPKAGVDAA